MLHATQLYFCKPRSTRLKVLESVAMAEVLNRLQAMKVEMASAKFG